MTVDLLFLCHLVAYYEYRYLSRSLSLFVPLLHAHVFFFALTLFLTFLSRRFSANNYPDTPDLIKACLSL